MSRNMIKWIPGILFYSIRYKIYHKVGVNQCREEW